MFPNIPVKKSNNQIKSYLKHGPYFGNVLKELYSSLKNGELSTGLEVEQEFKKLSQKYEPAIDYPFSYQYNIKGEKFGHAICVSVNDNIAHCKPSRRKFKDGDIISVDCGWRLDKLMYDAAFTVIFKDEDIDNFIFAEMPLVALTSIRTQPPIDTYKISEKIKLFAQGNNITDPLDIVTALAGHGIGEDLHEAPRIHNAPGNFEGVELFNGLVFCAEPIYVLKKEENILDSPQQAQVYIDSNGWTVKTINKQPSTHWETMFCVHNDQLIDIVGISSWDLK